MQRIRTDVDIEKVVAMGARMHPRSRFSKWPMDLDRSRFILERIKDADSVFPFYAEEDGAVVALLIGEVASDHSVDVRIASTLMLYADDSALGAIKLCRLIQAFEEWAHGRADIISIDVSGGVQDERLAALLEERMGYGPGGRRVVKEVDHGA
jgi:hypothetical protein